MWGPINHDAQMCEKSLPYLGFVIYNCLIKIENNYLIYTYLNKLAWKWT